MDSFIETFHIDWKTIVAQTINFAIVLFVLYFLMIKPLKKIMSDRSKTIEDGLNDAKINKDVLEKTKNEYNSVIANAKSEAYEVFQAGKKEAEDKKSQMMKEASIEVENMIANGKKMLESEKIKMLEEAKQEIVSLVVKATEKLLEENDSKNFDEKILNQIKKI